ncbi:MAG: hypothetical protein QXS37_06480 [Candidatus Aenigmatarchaeota archaeon]
MLSKKGIGAGMVVVLIILGLLFIFELVIFSQHYYHGKQQLRALGEAQLLSESSKLETWVRSFQKASELSLIESIIDTSSALLPYEFEQDYSPSNLPYWQIYDNLIEICAERTCPEEIFRNYLKQKISLLSLNYLSNYKKGFESLSNSYYKISFYGELEPRIEISDENIYFENKNLLSFSRNFTDFEGNKINISRQTFLSNYFYAKLGKIVKKAIEILENNYIGKCLANDSSLPICYHNKLDSESAKKALKNFEKVFEESDIEVSFDLDKFGTNGNKFFGIVNVSILDNTSSFVAYDFLNDSMKLDFIGLKFAVKVGDWINNFYQTKAQHLNLFKKCSDHLGILGKKNDICNYFPKASSYAIDQDWSGIADNGDPYLFGVCIDNTGEYMDLCVGNVLYEYYPSNNLCYFKKFYCEECNEGKCKSSFCFDSDGLNPFIKGYVQYDSTQKYDFCVDNKNVGEYYCDSTEAKFEILNCKDDCYCSDGACSFPETCKQLNATIMNAFGSRCGDVKYNPIADLNKDGVVDIKDVVNFSQNICNSTFCFDALSNTYNPCVCNKNGICEVGENCANCYEDCPCQ